MKKFSIAILPGDGIGKEIVSPCFDLLTDSAAKAGGFTLEGTVLEAGAECYVKTGMSFPPENFQAAKEADAILLGAMGLPDVRYPDGTEITPPIELRAGLQLYAGVRPIKAYPGIPHILASEKRKNIDFIVLRESTEGLYSSRDKGTLENGVAHETLEMTQAGCERIIDYAFRLARQRRGKGGKNLVTCVDKANVLRAFKFFRDIFDAKAKQYPDVDTNYCYADAMAMNIVKRPWDYDVLVMENLLGDVLSDLGAGIIGGLGMAPSGDIGDSHAVFQPSHGSAPDIMGQDKANPLAMFLSGAMMLQWLADMHNCPDAARAGNLIERAVSDTLASGTVMPCEFGGTTGTRAMTDAVRNTLARVNA